MAIVLHEDIHSKDESYYESLTLYNLYLVFCVDEFKTGLPKQLGLEEKVHQDNYLHSHDYIL